MTNIDIRIKAKVKIIRMIWDQDHDQYFQIVRHLNHEVIDLFRLKADLKTPFKRSK